MAKLFIKQIPIGPMLNFTYLIGGQDSGEAIVIDPAWDAPTILREAEKAKRKIAAVFLTHTHFDHCNAASKMANKVPVYVHEKELEALPAGLDLKPTKEKMTIEGIAIRCIHTPGHTPGSQCFLIGNALFTGDTLFIDGCGRVDLPGSNPHDMKSSLAKIAALSDEIVVFPGHDYGTKPTSTIGEQRKTNPYMTGEIE